MRRAALALALLSIGLTTASFASGGTNDKPTAHQLDLTIRQIPLSTRGNPPFTGSEVAVGTMHGTYAGAEVSHIQFPMPGQFTATARVFTATGSVQTTQNGTGMLNSDGSVSGSGKGEIVGGAGRFKGARGKFRFTFTGPGPTGTATFHITGAVRY